MAAQYSHVRSPSSNGMILPSAPSVAEDGASRPKFSRRPASFSPAEVREELPARVVRMQPEKPKPSVAVTATPWQEDIRFGLALVALLLLANLGIIYLMPLLNVREPRESIRDTTVTSESVPHSAGDDSGVTVYAQPEEERSIPQQLNLQNASGAQNELSTSPHQFPPPVAQPMDPKHE